MQKYRVEVDNYGIVRWYKYNTNQLHREDGPAIEYANGSKCWWLNDQRHREDGPAIECITGDKSWYLNGKCLSENKWKQQLNKDTCDGKVVEIEGKKYKLTEV